MSSKPCVAIFGGLNTCSRTLAVHLIQKNLVSYVRIVDKFSVHPPTTYLGSEFEQLLNNPLVEYRQANLTHASKVPPLFDPPQGKPPFDYIFDLTGDPRHVNIQVNATCDVARNVAQEAAKRKVKAYVRLTHPFYETSSKTVPDESVDIKPRGDLGTWWHETLRILGNIPDLNLVIVRAGLVFGPYVDFGYIPSALAVAAVYGYKQEPMKSLWSPGKHPEHTVHINDVAGAMWACAEWIAPLGRAEANKIAGEKLPFHNDPEQIAEVAGVPAPDANIIAPLFNIVDDSENTLAKCGTAATAYFGTTFTFFNAIESTLIKLKDVEGEINEHHVGGWIEMIAKSNPPLRSPNQPATAYMDSSALSKRTYAADNSKIKSIVGYNLVKPSGLDQEAIGEIIDKWKAEGSWPVLN